MTDHPGGTLFPPVEEIPDFVPAHVGGGGVAWSSEAKSAGGGGFAPGGGPSSGGTDGRPPPAVLDTVFVHPGGAGVGVNAGGAGPITSAVIGGGAGGGAGLAEGARAAAVAGALLGLLVLGSGVGWALYKFKPGLIGGGGGAGAGALNISAPRATTNYQLVKAVGMEMNGNIIGGGVANAGTQTTIQGQGITAYSQQFTTLQAFNASNQASGIAGVVGGAGTVTRPVQTDLVREHYIHSL